MEVHFVVTFFFICQHELGFQLQMALEIRYTMLSPFALALDFKITFSFYIYVLLKLLCMVSNVLHSSLSVCGCVGLKIWRAEREWTCEENAIDSCRSLSFLFLIFLLVLLHLSPLFFTRPVCLSLPVCVSPYALAFLLSIPPPIYLSISLSCDVVR